MTALEFLALCVEHNIEPAIALENDAIIEALKAKNDEQVILANQAVHQEQVVLQVLQVQLALPAQVNLHNQVVSFASIYGIRFRRDRVSVGRLVCQSSQ